MKTLITSIAILFISLNVHAMHDRSALNLKMFDNGNFSVVLDNKQAFSQSGFFSAAKIEPGYHMLKVFRFYPDHHGYGMHKKMIYKGWISIPPKSVVYAKITCHNQFDVVKVEPYFCPPAGGGCGNGWHHDGCDGDCGYDDDGYGYNCGGGNEWGSGYGYTCPPLPPVPVCMSQVDFMRLKSSMEEKSFETSKLQIAKQALGTNNFTSAQVADLMTEFSFETTRLDFAKDAYGKVIDKKNYHLVNNSFSFESSIQDLNQYIAKAK